MLPTDVSATNTLPEKLHLASSGFLPARKTGQWHACIFGVDAYRVSFSQAKVCHLRDNSASGNDLKAMSLSIFSFKKINL
jgi:hypothetical protein